MAAGVLQWSGLQAAMRERSAMGGPTGAPTEGGGAIVS